MQQEAYWNQEVGIATVTMAKQVTVTLRTNLRRLTHITAKFAYLVSHRSFCYIYLAQLTISRHLSN